MRPTQVRLSVGRSVVARVVFTKDSLGIGRQKLWRIHAGKIGLAMQLLAGSVVVFAVFFCTFSTKDFDS
jgi:hypothetical protein